MGWNRRKEEAAPALLAPVKAEPAEEENVEALLRVEPLAIQVGLGLVKMVDSTQGGSLLKRIAGVRRQLAGDLGFVLPPVRVTDNLQLKPREYVVMLKGRGSRPFRASAELFTRHQSGPGTGVARRNSLQRACIWSGGNVDSSRENR